MNITVLGTGSVAHSLAAQAARKGMKVTLVARTPEQAARLSALKSLAYNSPDGDGDVAMPAAVMDAGRAVADASIVILAVPAYGHEPWLARAEAALQSGQALVVIGSFGGLRILHRRPGLRARRISVVEVSTSPFPCRSFAPGTVTLYGRRPSLPAAIYASDEAATGKLVSPLFDNLKFPANPLGVGLSATNPVVHAPLMLLNAGRVEAESPESWNLFRDGATPAVVEMMLACDAERRAIAERLGVPVPGFAAGRAPADTPEGEVAVKISEFFRRSPMHIDPRHHTPDSLTIRYVTEDIPYAFAIWAALGQRLGIATPALEALLTIYRTHRQRIGGDPPLGLADLGLDTLDAEGLRRFRATDAAAIT